MANKTAQERLGIVETKIDEVCDKLTDHIKRQDEFEKRIDNKMDDLNLILKAFKFIGWVIAIGITAAIGAAVTWTVNHFLNRG